MFVEPQEERNHLFQEISRNIIASKILGFGSISTTSKITKLEYLIASCYFVSSFNSNMAAPTDNEWSH